MSFKDFFHKYKILAFVGYALMIGIAMMFITVWWVNLIIFLPLVALGVFIVIEIFPRRESGYLTAVCADGLGSVHIRSSAIVKAVRDAAKAVTGIRYQSCSVLNDKAGVIVKLDIRIAHSKVLEITEVTRVFIKKLLEKEMNVRVGKIDIIVSNVVYNFKVNKIEPAAPEPEKTEPEAGIETAATPVAAAGESYDENAPSYVFEYEEKQSTFRVPSNNRLKTREIKEPIRAVKTIERFALDAQKPAAAQKPVKEETGAVEAPQKAPPPAAGRYSETEVRVAAERAPFLSRPGDPHKDVEEVALPATTPKTSAAARAQAIQLQREEAARKFAELKAKQEQRRIEKNGN